MLWVIIGILGVVGAIVYSIYQWADGYFDFGEAVLNAFLITALIFMVIVLVSMVSSYICDDICDKEWYVSEDTNIYALQDNVSAQGRFFLGSGHVDGKLKYFYVEETELGYAVRNVGADNTYIRYTNGECHMETLSYEFTNDFVRLIAVPVGVRYVFYIPEGSIVQNYTIDLQ